MFRNLILKIYTTVGIESKRTKNIVKHIGWSFFYKIGSVVLNFLLVPISINYLDTENYGIWLTLTSFISWFSFFDIGLGNGLRNKFAEAKAKNQLKIAQAYVSTAYFTISLICLLMFFLFIIINFFIDWTIVFNTSSSLKKELTVLLPIIFSFFLIQLVLKLITSIYQADQNHSIQGKIQFFSRLLILVSVWLVTNTNYSSLLLFGSLFSAIPCLILLVFNLFAFKTKYKIFKPKAILWDKKYLVDISGLGFKFFFVQIAAMVLFSTDNFIISRLFGPEEVVPYDVAFKYFSIITLVYSIIITPYWSSFTEAYTNEDIGWIKRSVNNIQKIWCLVPVMVVLMFFLSDWFYNIWVGKEIDIPVELSICMGFFVILLTFNMIYTNFINGIGKIKLSLITAFFSIITNIPLSIYFGKYLNMGSSGVILATCFCLFYSLILRPLQYFKIIRGKAKGIWNK